MRLSGPRVSRARPVDGAAPSWRSDPAAENGKTMMMMKKEKPQERVGWRARGSCETMPRSRS